MSYSYMLPNSPEVLCEDRFSILDSDDLNVPFWAVFEKLLERRIDSTGSLIDLLETIAVVRRGKTDSDYGSLRSFLADKESAFFGRTWPVLANLALQMPELFPEERLPVLDERQASLALTKKQAACLVIHQFLCTLTAPSWQDGFQDFHIWYSEDQPHGQVVYAYLTALFEYFERLATYTGTKFSDVETVESSISYTLHDYRDGQLPGGTKLKTLEIVKLPEPTTSPDVLGIPNGAAVISANKYIGFGRTGTQEETHVGASSDCCPAVLVTPPLRDDQVLVVEGVEAMVTIAGYGREARCAEVLKEESADGRKWSRRTMLFMDALELDLEGRDKGLPDLKPGNVERELRKAYLAFNSRKRDPYAVIYTGYWGCRTFGGNPGIKALVQWCAASLAGCPMRFVCSGKEQNEFGSQLEGFARQLANSGRNGTDDLLNALRQLTPEGLGGGDPLVYLQHQLCP